MSPDQIPALYEKHGSLKAIARQEGVAYGTVERAYHKAVQGGLMPLLPMGRKTNSDIKMPVSKQRNKAMQTKRDKHHTYILTCAQNNTNLHDKTWVNLLALALHKEAKVYVSRFVYQRRGLGARNDKAQIGAGFKRDQDEIWWDDRIKNFINDERVEIAKGLVWCGELNILPTAERPLSGLEVYTGRASMIVPHTHIAMQSIATLGGDGAKLNYTTGTVTKRNYIQRKAGFKAEFHHCYGALLVEVDEDGHWWARQLNADSNGVIHDLDLKVEDGIVTEGHRVEGVNLGDTHVDNMDQTIFRATFEPGGMMDVLQPKHIFVHDVLDMGRRGHHKIKDPYAMLYQHAIKRDSVEEEVMGVKAFLRRIKRDDCLTIVVDSNHDRHLDRWLTENDGRYDPPNARYWSLLNLWKTDYISRHHSMPDVLHLAVSANDPTFTEANHVVFLGSDTSFVLCPKFGGGIECGLHGDRGAGGSRGSLRQFAKMGRRCNVGHSHAAGIDGGAYQAGTNSLLKLEYNHGLSAWTHSDIVTYPNGKRAIVTFFNGKWRA